MLYAPLLRLPLIYAVKVGPKHRTIATNSLDNRDKSLKKGKITAKMLENSDRRFL